MTNNRSQTFAPETWWLMHCAFPDLVWARLRVDENGSVEVLEASGKSAFPSLDAAKSYLIEDEYAPLDALQEDEDEDPFLSERLGRSLKEVKPPSAATEEELVTQLVQHATGQPKG